MFFTSSQLEFKENFLRPDFEGKSVEFPQNYHEAYALWKETQLQVELLSPEERLASFEEFLKGSWIPSKAPKTEIKGPQLLASTDGGQHFDLLINQENLAQVEEINKKTPLQFLSSTFLSSTQNVETLFDQERLLHCVRQLEGQHFLVESAEVKNKEVKIKARHARAEYEVNVDLSGEVSKTLIYEFINLRHARDKKEILETELPEHFRENALVSIDLKKAVETGKLISVLGTDDSQREALAAANAAAATAAVMKAKLALEVPRDLQGLEAAKLHDLGKEALKNSLQGINVRAVTKVQAQARMRIHAKQLEDGQNREQELYAKAQMEQQEKILLKMEEERQMQMQKSKKKSSGAGMRWIKLGFGLGMGLGAGATGLTALVLNNSVILGS